MFNYKYFDDFSIELIDGDRGKNYPKNDEMLEKGYCLFLNAKNVTLNGFAFDENVFITKEKDEILRKGKLNRNDIVLTTRGTIGNVGLYDDKITYDNVRINSGMLIIRNNDNNINTKYLYYQLTSPFIRNQIFSLKTGSAQPQIPIKVLKKLKLIIPDKRIQDKIVRVMDSIINKLTLNNEINNNLYEIGDNLYNEYFGKHKDNLTFDYKIVKLNEVADNYDSKRKPMSSREREQHRGIYPYYGATSIIDYVDNYVFDDTYLLMGEDGTVKTDEGYPVLQYIWGKNWINNHAHVLKGKKISTEHLYFALRNVNIEPLITGAVQLKINQENMNKIQFVIGTEDINNKFETIIKSIMDKSKQLIEENKTLGQLRNVLLPKLMNGEIDLNK